MEPEQILESLEKIVGKDFVSNEPEELFIYSQDPGASEPRPANFVVMPKTVDEIQNIVRFANKEKIPIIPMGGGLTLSGLTIPGRGGIVVDLKRMDKIIEVNELCRYAVLEAGVTTGRLKAYINENFPDLQPPIPDSPTAATVAGNVLIHGSGALSQKYGDHSGMINGLEVVLPNGEVCKLGSCAVSDYWFSKGPIPDMIGLFTSSFGTMGIITKLSVKLFPNPKMRDIVFGMATDLKILPKIMSKVTYMEFVEDVMIGKSGLSETTKNFGSIMTYITGESQEEMDSKRNIIEGIYKEFNVINAKLPERNLNFMLARPQFTAVYAADFRKGGGFEYVGSFIPLDKIPEALERGTTISEKYGIIPALLCRLIGSGAVMFSATFPFNRADPDDMKNAREGLEETNRMVLDIGGIPWKTELTGQKMIMEKIDPNYKKLFTSIRGMLDPNGIMNPGNWEV